MEAKTVNNCLLAVVAILLGAIDTSLAQRQMPGSGESPIAVGSQLADVTAYLEDGTSFPLKEKLKGKHAVLVFGCLT